MYETYTIYAVKTARAMCNAGYAGPDEGETSNCHCQTGAIASICDGDIFSYDPWGGNCVALWVEGELWVRRINIESTSGSMIFKTTNGDGIRLLNGEEVMIL